MDRNKKEKVSNPRQGANFLSVISFKWLLGTYLTGYKRELEVEDLYSPLKEHKSSVLGNKLSKYWTAELSRSKKPSLLKALAKCFGCDFIMFGLFFTIIELCLRIAQPYMLINFLKYFASDEPTSQSEGLFWGTCIFVGQILECVIVHPSLLGIQHIGMKLRVACCSLVYRKVLNVGKTVAEGDTSVGQMINLLSNDVNRLDYAILSFHYIWLAPLQTVIISYLLYRSVSVAAFGGIFILLLFMPVHGCCGKLASRLTVKFSLRTDKRLGLINEIISGVKVIKMYAWEKPFSHLVDKAREKELRVNKTNSIAAEIWYSLEVFIPPVCMLITILLYILLGNDIDVEKAYIVTAFYNVLRTSLYRYFTMSVKDFVEALVSVRRLQKFLLFEEIQDTPAKQNNHVASKYVDKKIMISFDNLSAKWNPDSQTQALKQVSLSVESGMLIGLVGQVGAGKSTLLHAILGELPCVSGELKLHGGVSYASQESWLFGSSVKQNIIFGAAWHEERYNRVIEVCQLRRDFALLPHGDGTLVGERGFNLSGGQCARINLARAVYREADVYLLDDPLSAVDARVGRNIFERCILEFLRGKTVILVTHQFQYLKHVDRVVVLDDGAVQAVGSYAELRDAGVDLLGSSQPENELEKVTDESKNKDDADNISFVNYGEEEEQSESRTLGKISAKTYVQYFKTCKSWLLVAFVLVIGIVSQIITSSVDYFLAYWVNIEEEGDEFTSNISDDPFRGRGTYVYIYAALTLLTILFIFLKSFAFFTMCMRISRNLHDNMFNSIIRTTMGFFNANPVGRIMNRFSKDMGIIDTRVPLTIIDVMLIFIYFVVVIGMVVSVQLWLLIPSFIIVLFAYFFHKLYARTSRSVKRLEGITRSPVFNHLSASVLGLTTIRALNAQSILTREFDNHQDLHSSAWFIFFSGSRALGMYMEFLGCLFTGVVIYSIIILRDSTQAGDAALLVTQCMLLSRSLQWGIRQITELENQMTSVERILEYGNLPSEPKLEPTTEASVPVDWPKQGRIDFKNVNLTYEGQESAALKDLSFTVEPGEMVGIVGRTGAGKSSIINALFRLAELEGHISIDGLSTDQIALQHLRSKISIIPQEPVLFAGSLRRNLDPFEEYSDHELWLALEYVEMKSHFESDLGLEARVLEGGKNFSVGQKQLLCLARAIVRNNKILVLDEATANVDPRTDDLIQKAIRRKFVNCTVLIIAHRLNTVMDCNRILVMDAGRVAEFDHPYNLFQRKDGIFYNMVLQTGEAMFQSLYEVAKSCWASFNDVTQTERM